MGESHVKNLKLLLLCFLHYCSIPKNELSLKPHNLNCCGCLLVTLTEYVYCPACWIILPHPWGKLIKTQLFGKQHFKGFCEIFLFLILPRISSQKIKDSQPTLKNSSNFNLHGFSSTKARKKVAHFTPLSPTYLHAFQQRGMSRKL